MASIRDIIQINGSEWACQGQFRLMEVEGPQSGTYFRLMEVKGPQSGT